MIVRSSRIGSKEVIFLIRHENDLDFMLPIILYATNPIVFFWGVFKKKDFRVKMLKRHKVNAVFLHGSQKSLSDKICLKIFRILSRSIFQKYAGYINKRDASKMLISFENHLEKIDPQKVNNVVFDHTVNDTVKSMISILRKWKRENLNILSLPHSHGLIANRMTNYGLIKPPEKAEWSIFDKIVSFNEHQALLFEDVRSEDKIVIPSLRNTTEWANLLSEELKFSKDPYVDEKIKIKKINFLIIHNRTNSNVNYQEVIRSIKILDQFDCFDVRVKPHPRRVSDALELVKIAPSLGIMNEHISKCVHWSDCIMFFHSSAVYEAMLFNKPILYMKYASSNQIDETILKYFNVLETPDDFYNTAKQLAKKKDIVFPNYYPPEWNHLIEDWRSLLNRP